MRANLVLHTGARTVDRERLASVATPERTETWVPIAHDRLLDGIQQQLTASGLITVSESHGLTADGMRYFGLIQLRNGTDDGDHGLVVGIRNSHDKKFPAGLVVGSQVFVCDNLSFSGEIRLARKHTAHIERDLPRLIETAVGRIGLLRRTQEQRFDAYRHTELTDSQVHDLVIRALDTQVVPVTRIPTVLTEWRTPRHEEFERDGKTAWRLFNAVTEALKGNMDALPSRTTTLHGLLDAACGLVIPSQLEFEAEVRAADAVVEMAG